ncbi:hypothetical protein CBR_g30829 [Chara braunii]|uniref:Transmembrane protein 50A n=1 Tax=Chara braunii TaxID=69332 RepID=A0A388JXG8_CHABU|nr:hypothetical protein CBR_g30829 [Chara braunii]|eukprot:GBG62511.1 hypothetical protein CBR_g30829 [Chara braunii]
MWVVYGPGLAGAVFGGGWWFWVDAVVCSKQAVAFLHYLPGILASLAALMFNCVRREDLRDHDSYDDSGCRSRTWLFIAYVISFASLAAAVGMLIADTSKAGHHGTWPGVAGILQCTLILGSGLMYWTSRRPADYF